MWVWFRRAAGVLCVAIAASTIAIGGCAPATPYLLLEDAPKSGDLERLVLLPMNFDHSPQPELAPGTQRMGERIRDYLAARGYAVVVPRMSITLAHWKECTRDVGGIADALGSELDEERYEQARSELVRRILADEPADAVIASTVMVREGRYSGKNLRWDGVVRPALIDMGNTNMPIVTLKGTDPVTSLRTSIFDGEGRVIFERFAGLEPVLRYQVKYPRMEIVKRKDLFQDDALIEAAIASSFQPWLAPLSIEAE